MANHISFSELGMFFSMSNGLTQTFVEVLVLSGSQIAQTESEKRFVVWMSEKDQSQVGRGMVGFDICEMPWSLPTFESDKYFLTEMILQAKKKRGWEHLQYRPNEEILFEALDSFFEIVLKIKPENIKEDRFLQKWLQESGENDPIYCGFPKCAKHQTFLSLFGCCVCNNES